MEINLKNINLVREGHNLLSDINLSIKDHEYLTIVGPTGAGKSSLVAIIAGIYQQTSGEVHFNGTNVSNYPPEDRHCGFMFESYALFPHLTVMNNICYGQHMKTNNHKSTYILGKDILKMVRLVGRGDAYPSECSGGMRQRVALARALMAIEENGILIIDEPFKALDAGLKMNLRREVKRIAKHKKINLTTIHVTNDMQEAMLGDRIVVLNNGKIEQIGTPNEILYNPYNYFVANFFSTELNKFTGIVEDIRPLKEKDKIRLYKDLGREKVVRITIKTDFGKMLYAKIPKYITNLPGNPNKHSFNVGDEVNFLIRPHYYKARHEERLDKPNSIVGKIITTKFMGSWLKLDVELDHKDNIGKNKILKVEIPTTKMVAHNFHIGEKITLYYSSEYVIVFPTE